MYASAENDHLAIPGRIADAWRLQANSDPAMAYILAGLQPIVEAGHATPRPIDGGVLELRLLTGEIFHLGATGITRID
jgi:hypothetical protein